MRLVQLLVEVAYRAGRVGELPPCGVELLARARLLVLNLADRELVRVDRAERLDQVCLDDVELRLERAGEPLRFEKRARRLGQIVRDGGDLRGELGELGLER